MVSGGEMIPFCGCLWFSSISLICKKCTLPSTSKVTLRMLKVAASDHPKKGVDHMLIALL